MNRLLSGLTNPQVRDLAWAVLSPPLVGAPLLRSPLAASVWRRKPDQLHSWLRALERRPGVLEEWLLSTPVRRLGLYYERLWQFALLHSPDVRLVAANLPIREGGRTLGELDLIIEDSEGFHHIELAVKFYLGPLAFGEQSGLWLGPTADDRLDLKLARLQGDQLALARSAAAGELLSTLGIDGVDSQFWLAGYLFHSAGSPAAPTEAADMHLTGQWLYAAQWPSHMAETLPELRWQPIERQRWLAPVLSELGWEPQQLAQWMAKEEIRHRPQLLAACRQRPDGRWEEQARAFRVPNGWPDQQ